MTTVVWPWAQPTLKFVMPLRSSSGTFNTTHFMDAGTYVFGGPSSFFTALWGSAGSKQAS